MTAHASMRTAVERSLTHALGSARSAASITVSDGARIASRTLGWSTISLTGEGTLPGAVVTGSWPGHGRASSAAPTASAAAVSPDLSSLPMGAALVEVLAAVEVAGTSDGDLLDVAARWYDVVSWATAMQSRALGEVARRRTWTAEHNAAAAEVSARLRVPQGEANKHLARGAGLAEHPQVMDALHSATIDTAKADILLRSGNPLTTEEREQAITRYLPKAPDRTRRWLRDKMNAFAVQLKGTLETTKHARTRRAVFIDPADNAMAWISANLPATDAAAVWDAIDSTAHVLRRTPGSTRTLAQARADALVALATGRVIVPPRPECAPAGDGESDATALPRTTVPSAGCTCGGCLCGGTAVRVVSARPRIRVTVPATMLLGLDDSPGQLDGYGPIPADVAAQVATDATWHRLVTDPVTGVLTDYSTAAYQPGKVLRQAVVARDGTCSFPQCDRPARWSDLDHIQPFDHHLAKAGGQAGRPEQTRAANLQPLCRAHHLAKTHHGWGVVRDPETGITTWSAPTGQHYTRPPTEAGPHRGGATSDDVTSVAEDIRRRLGHRAAGALPGAGGRAERPATRRGPCGPEDAPPF